jgi:hypothetical protein
MEQHKSPTGNIECATSSLGRKRLRDTRRALSDGSPKLPAHVALCGTTSHRRHLIVAIGKPRLPSGFTK